MSPQPIYTPSADSLKPVREAWPQDRMATKGTRYEIGAVPLPLLSLWHIVAIVANILDSGQPRKPRRHFQQVGGFAPHLWRRSPALFLVRCYYRSSRFAPSDVAATTASPSRRCRARQHRAQSLPAADCSGGFLQSHTRSSAAAAAAVAVAGACAAGAAGADYSLRVCTARCHDVRRC